jgi:hypothetical protein
MPKKCSVEECDQLVWGMGYCKRHQYLRTDKKQKPIAPYSSKRKEENKVYDLEARKFREDNPVCAINSPHCTHRTQGVHHKRGRGKYLLDKSTWEPACNPCNHYVEVHHQWAIDNGHKESRLSV